MRGSDSERMMAEIEAFLRTGEAPPASPEPRPVASLPGADTDAPPIDPARPLGRGAGAGGTGAGAGARRRGGTAGTSGTGGTGWRSRFNPLRRGPVGRAPGGRFFGGRLTPGGRRWSAGGRGSPARPGFPSPAPRWTVLRAIIVAAVLVGLLLIPEVFRSRSNGSGSGSGGADHASAAPAGPGYRFLSRNRSGTPVRWNPCEPIYYVTDLAAAPTYAQGDLASAVSQISHATGILFVDRGSTTTVPVSGPIVNPDGTAGPVVIAWADPTQTSQLPTPAGATGAASLAVTAPVESVDQSTGHGVYVTGTVLIGSGASRLPHGFTPGGLGVLFLHELGQLMGLGNVTAPAQVMDTAVLSTATTALGPGDLAGLKRLGTASGCLTVPSGGTLEPRI